jgi:hypothetical protein
VADPLPDRIAGLQEADSGVGGLMTFIGGVSVIVILALLASGLVYDALAYVAALIIGELLCARYLAFRSPIRDMRVGTEGIELRFEGTRSPGPFLVPWSKIRPVRLDLSSKKPKFRPSLGEPPRSKYWLYFPDPRPPRALYCQIGVPGEAARAIREHTTFGRIDDHGHWTAIQANE